MSRLISYSPCNSRVRIPATALAVASCLIVAATVQAGDWISLFNGKDLAGWTVTQDNPQSIKVEEGAIKIAGPRAHLYYTGPVANHDFKDFEFRAQVMTRKGANSGLYFHTKYQQTGWPQAGYEAQVNNSHSDPKRTASLWSVADNVEVPAKDDEWFEYYIKVVGKHVQVRIDGRLIIDYVEPKNPPHWGSMPGRRIGSGTFAIQAHDPNSIAFFKDIEVKPL